MNIMHNVSTKYGYGNQECEIEIVRLLHFLKCKVRPHRKLGEEYNFYK